MEYHVANDKLEELKKALEEEKEKNPADMNRKTLLHVAAEKGKKEIVKFLIKRIDNPENCNPADANGVIPFILAVKNGHKDVWECLANTLLRCNKLEPLLHEFSKAGDLASVKAITDTGLLEDPNPADSNGVTPFFHAAKNADYDVCRHLANIIKVKQPNNPDLDEMLMDHARKGNLDWVKVFTDILSNPNPPDAYGKTPFHWAATAWKGHLEMVKHFYGLVPGDINIQNKWKWTPLHLAAYRGKLEVVKFISERIESTTLKNSSGYTPLDYAKDNSPTEVVKYLEQKRLEEQPKSEKSKCHIM